MDRPTRRQLLQLAAVAVASSAPVGLGMQALAATAPVRLMRRTFQPHVGKTFKVTTSRGASYSAVLTSVGNLPSQPAGHEHRFRLFFTTRAAGPPQGTYRFETRGVAPVSLFVVPVGRGRTSYEAVVHSR